MDMYIIIHNIYIMGFFGVFGHLLYWVLWKYIDPQSIEDTMLRLIGIISSAPLLLYHKWPAKLKNKINYYWFLVLCYNFSFLFCSYFILNNFSLQWSCAMMASIYTLVMLLPNIFLLFLNIITGTLLANIYVKYAYGIDYNFPDNFLLTYIPLFGFALFVGLIFTFSNVRGIRNQTKFESYKSMAGSIAHELRNPISSIRLSASSININSKNTNANNLKKFSKDQLINLVISDTNEIIDHKHHLESSIKLANSIIDMTLADLRGKKITNQDLTYIDSNKIINQILRLYPFKTQIERDRVNVALNGSKPSFIFKGVETPFYYIIFNLIKNSLYYVSYKPYITIKISRSQAYGKDIIDKKIPDSKLNLIKNQYYNIIHIKDTGPGIHPEILQRIFGSFITSGKKEGTGLGLAFCKRTMVDFGGDIDCESKYGKWTQFNLYFPQISEDEAVEARAKIAQKCGTIKSICDKENIIRKILIVDDQEVNLRISEKQIHSLLPNAVVDLAINGQNALEMIKANNKKFKGYYYDLIITDIQMPNMDGFELVERVRGFDNETPIAAYTSRTSYKIKQKAINLGIDDYIIKPIPNNGLPRVIYKWLVDSHLYDYDFDKIKVHLEGLKVLIADDEIVNIMILKKFLKKYKINADYVSDGDEMIKKYKSQFKDISLREFDKNDNPHYKDPNLVNSYDVIIADISMPKLNGDLAAKEIRDFEHIYNIQNKSIIIAYSGNGDQSKLKSALKNCMDDYFIKGHDNLDLLKTIYFWISNTRKNHDSSSLLNIYSKQHSIEKIRGRDCKLINSKLDSNDMRDLSELFISSINDLMSRIIDSKKDNNVANLAFHSHALKGIAGNFGAEKLFIYITMVNNHARRNHWPSGHSWLDELQDIVENTIKEVKNLS
ncbi:MAG: hypothetical protein CMP18_00690 [Rickettsiales bacterium]|nr:hypothetical protein [Rickettsiales bacterium]